MSIFLVEVFKINGKMILSDKVLIKTWDEYGILGVIEREEYSYYRILDSFEKIVYDKDYGRIYLVDIVSLDGNQIRRTKMLVRDIEKMRDFVFGDTYEILEEFDEYLFG